MRPVIPLIAVAVVILALAAVAAPLLTYALSLAVFGIPHVLTELRYVDERFGKRVSPRLGYAFLGLILGIVAIRVLALSGITMNEAPRIELLLVLGLAAATLPILKRSARSLGAGMLVLGVVGAGIILAPLTTLVLLAVAHNLTPIGFLLDQSDASSRKAVAGVSAIVFGLIPLVIFSGLPAHGLAMAGWETWQVPGLGVGSLTDHLGVFVPAGWQQEGWAEPMFAAAAYLQCVHYAVVIHVLPRLNRGDHHGVVAWPRARIFQALVVIVGLIFLAGFALSFTETRSLYGVFAAIHAWIEVPILLLALEPGPRRHAISLGAS